MKRSPIWCAAFALAWQRLRGLRVFPVVPPGDVWAGPGEPMPPADIAQRCAVEADACEAAYLAAFPE